MKQPKLKRCPFCGGKANLYNIPSHWWQVQCTNCAIMTMMRGNAEECVEDWNRRVADD